jgi:hypothetical protein
MKIGFAERRSAGVESGRKGIRIGELLVEHGVLTEEQVQLILEEQRRCSRPFGDLAERMFGVAPKAIEDAWVAQYLDIVGVTDLETVRVDVQCLRVLSRRQAWQFHVLPLNRDGGELSLATDETNLVRALNFATHSVDEVVLMHVAERDQLREFLMKHFPVPREIAEYSEKLVRAGAV